MIKDSNKRNARVTVAIVAVLYALRLYYCYSSYFIDYNWQFSSKDESNIYLMGLRFFLTHQFPCWGPDVTYTHTYLVGGMQGFLVGAPLFVWAHPFAPYLFLFIIVSASLIYLSWYSSKLFPGVKPWLIYTLIAIAPFTVHTGLHVINPTYVLCFTIPFMLSLVETLQLFEKQYIRPGWRFFWMGLATTSVFQLNSSWVLLFALFGVGILYTWFIIPKKSQIVKLLFMGGLGMLLGALTLIPLLYHYGTSHFSQQGKVVNFSLSNIGDFTRVVYYIITQCEYEMNVFDTNFRISAWLDAHNYVGAGVFILMQVTGLLLFASQILFLFWKKWRPYIRQSKRFLWFMAGLAFMLSIMYMFSVVRPRPHMFVILFPLSALYLFWFLQNLFKTTRIRYSWFAVFSVGALIFYGMALHQTFMLPDLGYRAKLFEAFKKKDPTIFEHPRYIYPQPIR